MYSGQLIFSQFLEFLPKHEFTQCVARYQGNRRARKFRCWDQFMVMAFAQITYRESLRDIETCLRSMPQKLYHAGIKGSVARSTLAEANETRDWRIWADFAAVLIAEARGLHADETFGFKLKANVYVFDTTTIDLCLTLFPWAHFRKHKSAVKMHTLLDLRGNIPCFISITDGSVHEVNALDELPLEAGSYYVMDRGFVDFHRLYRFHRAQAFFIIRGKSNMDYRACESRPVDASTGLKADQSIRLRGVVTRKDYPELLRRISFTDPKTGVHFVFLTNNFELAASTICRLYHCRWEVELFFKWIKQYLRIKAFFGNSDNAVKTQLWIAISMYVLAAIIKKRLHVSQSLGQMLQILSLNLFEKTPILQVFSEAKMTIKQIDACNSLPLLDI
jgi:transposase